MTWHSRVPPVACWFLSLMATAHGADQAPADIREAGKTAHMDALLASREAGHAPGCSVAAAKDGETVYSRGYGLADLEHGVPIRADTVFHAASISKQFTAASIVLLAQENRLSLDDPVGAYVAELPDFRVPITIRQLVHHTSGLRDQWNTMDVAGWRYSRDLITDQDILRVLARQKELNFPPGTQYSYSNTGYTLMGQIVRELSGTSLRAFTTERLFEPLGMRKTHFRDDFREIVPNVALGYTREGGTYKTSVTNFDTVGATGLLTTAEDLLLWQENFHSARVGSPAFVARLLERGMLRSGEEIPYAYGLEHGTYRGLPTVGHSGSDAGYVAHSLRFPRQHFSVAVLCNADTGAAGDLATGVADIYLADKLLPDEHGTAPSSDTHIELSAAELSGAVGTYLQSGTAFHVYRIAIENGRLYASRGDFRRELIAFGDGRFALDDTDAELLFDRSTGPSKRLVYRKRDGSMTSTFERVPELTPPPEQLQAYVGEYASDEFEISYRVILNKDRLMLTSLKLDPTELRPVVADRFDGDWANLTFDRDALGRVAGLTMSWWYGPETYRFVRAVRTRKPATAIPTV